MTEQEIKANAKKFDEILKKYGDIPMPKEDQWEGKPKSKIVKFLLNEAGFKASEVASYIGYTNGVFNTKMWGGTFSFEDILLIAHLAGYKIEITPKELYSNLTPYTVDAMEFFRLCKDKKTYLKLLASSAESSKEEKRKEFEKAKETYFRLKEEYGFE